jgi:nucleoside-diphosphate-sugar epimerase
MSDIVILITGATGFVGGAVLARMAELAGSYEILIVARPNAIHDAETRVINSVARFIGHDRAIALIERCQLIPCDLDDATFLSDPRLDMATHVLHLAANTSFRSVNSVRRTNIHGALAFAHRMKRVERLRRFLYVGTAYICGTNPPATARENDYPDLGVRHLVEYTRSKAECEALLESTAPELPLIVARPSVVIGHTRLGCRPSASIFWFYRVVHLLDRINCSVDLLNDIVPVDYTADALLMLLLKPSLQYRRYHVSAGQTASVTWREISAAFASARRESRRDSYREVEFETILRERHRLRPILGPGDEDHLLQALELYYRFCTTTIETFDNSRILGEGIEPPPRFTTYLGLCESTSEGKSVYDQMLDDE